MTAREMFYAMRGYFDQQRFIQQQAWERTRWTTWHLLNIQIPSNSKLKLTDLVEFEWEREERRKQLKQAPVISKEELERISRMYDGS